MPSIFDELPGFLELGAWTTRHIRPLFDLFRDEDVAPALALIIFGSALVLCFLFIIDSSFIRMQVRRRIRAVRSIKGKVEFAEAMPDIEKLMLRTKYLRHSWQKFRETLIEPSEGEERGRRWFSTPQGRKIISIRPKQGYASHFIERCPICWLA